MPKKKTGIDRPLTEANVIPILQSRIQFRSKFIASAEKCLTEQRDTIKQYRAMIGRPFEPAEQEQVSAVLGKIRGNIKELAWDQKLDRTILKALATEGRTTNYLQGMIDDVRGALR